MHKNPRGQYNTPKASNIYPVASSGELWSFAKENYISIYSVFVFKMCNFDFPFPSFSKYVGGFVFPTDIILCFYTEKVLLDFFILKCILPK